MINWGIHLFWCFLSCAFSLKMLFEKNVNADVVEYCLKPLHTIGKVSVNASILYRNQEICNKTNL